MLSAETGIRIALFHFDTGRLTLTNHVVIGIAFASIVNWGWQIVRHLLWQQQAAHYNQL
jgi:hypothetical protein